MANTIRITPTQMRSRANEYRTQAQTVQDVIGRMDALLRELQGEWEGAARRAYAARFAELRPGFVRAKDLIDEIARALDATATALEETDAQLASSMG